MDYNLWCIGCTIRKVKTRISDHLVGIANHQIHPSGATAHFIEVHNGNTEAFAFHLVRHSMGGDWRRLVLSHEAYWIPGGINYRTDLLTFY